MKLGIKVALVGAVGLLIGACGSSSEDQGAISKQTNMMIKDSELIAVNGDELFKGSAGVAKAKNIATVTFTTGGSSGSSGSASGVGDVEWLYADGYRLFELKAKTYEAEIWVATDLKYCDGDDPRPEHQITQQQIDYMLAELTNTIYPSNSTYFGKTKDRDGTKGLFAAWGYDWYESTDNPQRIMALVYNIVDEGYCDPTYPFYVAGYFWPTMNDFYADRNIIHIDSADWANRVGAGVKRPHLYEQVFTHEHEHAIHFDHDGDEDSWVDEGLADLAPYLAGYGHSAGHIEYYMTYHRTPLTVWGGGLEDYGASYLFQLYLLENFGGPTFVKGLVDEPLNGIAGIESQLAALGYTASFKQIYRDWTVANYLDQPGMTGVSGAKLGYDKLDIPSVDTNNTSINDGIKYYGSNNKGNLPIPRYWGGYKSGTVQYPIGQVVPYAPMYLTYKGYQPEMKSYLRGDATSGIAAYEGQYALWGGRGDLLYNAAKLASPVTLGPNAKLSFQTWYEIEVDWDYAFVQISEDGVHWTSLANANTVSSVDPAAHPDVVANLPGFSGKSAGWEEQVFDLSAYAGKTVQIRFLYVTDWAYNEGGFYADLVQLADDNGTVLLDDLESGAGGWDLDGFVHTTGLAECDWAVTYVNPVYSSGKFDHYQVTDGNMVASGPYQIDQTTLDTLNLQNDEATIIVSNRMPEDKSFPAGYLLLVEKGDAKK